ncbi:unnamed protein product [Ectocarpus sp. 8 AP-2014]
MQTPRTPCKDRAAALIHSIQSPKDAWRRSKVRRVNYLLQRGFLCCWTTQENNKRTECKNRLVGVLLTSALAANLCPTSRNPKPESWWQTAATREIIIYIPSTFIYCINTIIDGQDHNVHPKQGRCVETATTNATKPSLETH